MLRVSDLKISRAKFNLELNDLSFKPGDVILVIGPNGSGKTTFLRSLAGLLNYDGKISFNDKVSEKLGFKERAKFFGYLPQRVNLSEMLVKDFILMGRFAHTSIFSGYSKEDLEVVEQVASDFGVNEYLDRDISDLSQGEFQRVLLAKVFAQMPKVLLLDEPTTALDIGHKRSVREQVLNYKKANNDSIVIVSTHEPELFEGFSSGFIMLKNGKVFKKGTMDSYNKDDVLALFDIK